TKIGVNLNQIAKRLHLQHAKLKANGEEEVDLSEYPVKDIKIFLDIFKNVEHHLANMKNLIQEVV
ncbi:plasmid mobilization relaxosome protein MobC, partial [Rhodohalobacter sp. SW132]|uniref:plasmid mobilization relaxosome protein MobC n=1 Tax=Rhodohalobacter sp. SW132 TaxID=2293433 RepID=UPI000E22B6EE